LNVSRGNTLSAILGLDAGLLHASQGGARVAAESFQPGLQRGAEAGAKEGVKRFEPTISLIGGACIFTAGFFVPP
jgi:hypothetical protein